MTKALLNMHICLAVVLTPHLHASSAPQLTPVAKEGVTTITASTGSQAVLVRIRTYTLRNGQRQELSKFCPCGKEGLPCSVVDSLEIIVRGHALNVPLSVFCDLADVHYGQLIVKEQNSILRLEGGDASTSYVVKIEFDHKMVRHRTVEPGELPGQLMEETTYYWPSLGN